MYFPVFGHTGVVGKTLALANGSDPLWPPFAGMKTYSLQGSRLTKGLVSRAFKTSKRVPGKGKSPSVWGKLGVFQRADEEELDGHSEQMRPGSF